MPSACQVRRSSPGIREAIPSNIYSSLIVSVTAIPLIRLAGACTAAIQEAKTISSMIRTDPPGTFHDPPKWVKISFL